MQRAILTIGPQCAGKSTFCEKVVEKYPNVVMVSRDAILRRLFGSVWRSPYSNDFFVAWQELWKEAAEYLKKPDTTLIVDGYNPSLSKRREIVAKLRELGAQRVYGWHFVTPVDQCLAWSFVRNPVKNPKGHWAKIVIETREDNYRSYWKSFHAEPLGARLFTRVRRINVLKQMPADILDFSSKNS